LANENRPKTTEKAIRNVFFFVPVALYVIIDQQSLKPQSANKLCCTALVRLDIRSLQHCQIKDRGMITGNG
jgi:hypothetical protein